MKDFKVRCIDGFSQFITGKIYEVKDGTIIPDSGRTYRNIRDVAHLNDKVMSQFELVEEEKMFTKDDLKVGYVVEQRDGGLRMVMPYDGGLIFTKGDARISPDSYDNDLTCNGLKFFDIVKVYGHTTKESRALLVEKENRPLLWERKESPIELTIEEIARKFDVAADRIRIKE